MPRNSLTPMEIKLLEDALISDFKTVDLRLREGEYQYELAKTIANFQLDLYFPDVKDIIKKLYGEDKVNDLRLIRKIQTILKKMEKSGVVRILPKTRPWELQKYALLSFKFLDIDKNQVYLETEEKIIQSKNKLGVHSNQKLITKRYNDTLQFKVYILTLAIVVSYAVIVWNFLNSSINPLIFAAAFSSVILCSLILGRILAQKSHE